MPPNSLVPTSHSLSIATQYPDYKLDFIYFIDYDIELRLDNQIITGIDRIIKIIQKTKSRDDYELKRIYEEDIRFRFGWSFSLNCYVDKYNDEYKFRWLDSYQKQKLKITKIQHNMEERKKELKKEFKHKRLNEYTFDGKYKFLSEKYAMEKAKLQNIPISLLDFDRFIMLLDELKVPYRKYLELKDVDEYMERINTFLRSGNVRPVKFKKVIISEKIVSLLHHFAFNHQEDLPPKKHVLLKEWEELFRWLFYDVDFSDTRRYEEKLDDYVKYLIETVRE